MRFLNSLTVRRLLAVWLFVSCLSLIACLDRAPNVSVPPSPTVAEGVSVFPLTLADGHIYCTAFSINQRQGYWMTARHCSQISVPGFLYGEWTAVVYQDMVADIAVIQSGFHAPALKIAPEVPLAGAAIFAIGYPYGIVQMVTYGRIGQVLVRVPMDETGRLSPPSMFFDLTAAPGNSGSPVMDSQGRVVSVLWGGIPGSGHTLGSLWDHVNRIYRWYQ
jgi:hypothetical protein